MIKHARASSFNDGMSGTQDGPTGPTFETPATANDAFHGTQLSAPQWEEFQMTQKNEALAMVRFWRAEHQYQVTFGSRETANDARTQQQSWIAKLAAQ
jgi:hypothetical protein